MAAPEDDEDEWRFSLSDLEDEEGAENGEEGEDSDSSGSVAGSFSPSETIEPGDIDPENALFVVIGVLIGLLVVGAYATALF